MNEGSLTLSSCSRMLSTIGTICSMLKLFPGSWGAPWFSSWPSSSSSCLWSSSTEFICKVKDLVVLTLHPCDGFQELQAVQLVVIVGVVLLKVLHQQLGVVQAVDVHVLLLYLGLDVPETHPEGHRDDWDWLTDSLSLPVQVDVDVLMFRLVSPPLPWTRGLSRSWSTSWSEDDKMPPGWKKNWSDNEL